MNSARLLGAVRMLLLLPLLVLALPASAAGPQGLQAGAPIDDAGNILITDAVATAMANSGAGFVRLNFRLGPYPSDTAQFYSTYDIIVNRLRSKGLQVIGLLSNESWHGAQWQWHENNWENTGGNGYNTYIDQFGYMAGRVAGTWGGSATPTSPTRAAPRPRRSSRRRSAGRRTRSARACRPATSPPRTT